MNRRRLEAESLRDAMLAVSGELNPKMGGPGVLVPIEKEVEDLIFTEAEVVDLWPETPDPAEHLRRSLYLFRKRNVRYPLFDAFDAPDTQTACAQRDVSTHALQALVLLNSDFAAERARALAGRLYREAGDSSASRIDGPIAWSWRVPPGRASWSRQWPSSTPRPPSSASRLARGGPPLAAPSFVPPGPTRPRPRPGRLRPGHAQPQRIRLRPLIRSTRTVSSEPPRDFRSPIARALSRSRRSFGPEPPRFLKRSGTASACSGWRTCSSARPSRAAAANPLAPKPGHFPARAKRCIFLFMVGGPSHIDMFDPKPVLNKLDGQPLPPSFGKIHSQFLESDPLCLGSHRKWGRYGQSGMDMSDLVPHMHQHADDIALIRSCVADSVIHAPAMYQMNTGRVFMGYPSLGSWVTYGLGSENENLPALRRDDPARGDARGRGPLLGGGFLPARTRGRSSAAARTRSSTSSRRPSSPRTSSAGRSTCSAR